MEIREDVCPICLDPIGPDEPTLTADGRELHQECYLAHAPTARATTAVPITVAGAMVGQSGEQRKPLAPGNRYCPACGGGGQGTTTTLARSVCERCGGTGQVAAMSTETWNKIDRLVSKIADRAARNNDQETYRDADMINALLRNLANELCIESEKAKSAKSFT
jgi:hypothetical protein